MSGPAAPAATLSAACCSRRPIGTGASTLLLHAIGRCCCRRWRLAARGRAAPATEEDALRATDCIGWRALRAGGGAMAYPSKIACLERCHVSYLTYFFNT